MQVEVVVAATDLSPGDPLTSNTVTTESVSTSDIPGPTSSVLRKADLDDFDDHHVDTHIPAGSIIFEDDLATLFPQDDSTTETPRPAPPAGGPPPAAL